MQELSEKTGIRAVILEKIVDVLRNSGATKAVIYGSRGRGDWKDPSDIDIAYWGDNVDHTRLWGAMYDLPTIHKIDVVNFDTLSNEKMKEYILRDGLKIY
jgi:predicted nucleotidyltransferase